MPICDGFNGGNKREKKKKEKPEKEVHVEADATAVCAALNGHDVPSKSSEKDDVFDNDDVDGEDDDDENGLDENESGDDDDENGDDDSVGLDEVENARRQILDPSKQQKLRKGFRMASICWDDWIIIFIWKEESKLKVIFIETKIRQIIDTF